MNKEIGLTKEEMTKMICNKFKLEEYQLDLIDADVYDDEKFGFQIYADFVLEDNDGFDYEVAYVFTLESETGEWIIEQGETIRI